MLLLADKGSVSHGVDGEGQDNASHRSEEEEEEEEMEEEKEEKEEDSGTGTTKKTVPGTGAVCRTGLHIITLRCHTLMFQFQSHRNNKPIHAVMSVAL